MKKDQKLIETINKRLGDEAFINQHKASPKDFRRNRVLTFGVVFMLILRNSIKSLQLALNELFIYGHIHHSVSASAYSQARAKFKHSAFIELNDDAIALYYSDDEIKRWRRFRCIGVDGSKSVLPKTEEIQKEFGELEIKTQHIKDTYAGAMLLCCYDALNHIAIKSLLEPAASNEVSLASGIVDDKVFAENDLFIFDRGYASYEFLATLNKSNKNYMVRIPKNSFKETKSLFEGKGGFSKVVTLTAPSDKRASVKERDLPSEIKVRFVSVILSTGEIEVLATSLMDETILRKDFKELYGLRWGVEGFFNLVKGRLCLENFTGKTVESVKQDFWSTLFITNLETVLTEETEKEINSLLTQEQLPKKVNHAVSFNAIKNMVFEIFANNEDMNDALTKLKILFKTGSLVQRIDRNIMRKKPSIRRSYNYLRRIRKQVF